MWCIGALTEEYRHRMYTLPESYARPMSPAEPVIRIDEKSLQLGFGGTMYWGSAEHANDLPVR